MLDFTEAGISRVAVHHVGNKTNGDLLTLSRNQLDTSDRKLQELLSNYFLTPFADVPLYTFTFSTGDFNLNPLYRFASDLFDDPGAFLKVSRDTATHLFEMSVHPQIKPGDLFFVYFSRIHHDTMGTSDAIGIFKSENRQSFLKLMPGSEDFSLYYDDGINIDKLDKGCLILNQERDNGFRVCIVDRAGKSTEAQFWKEDFLNLRTCKDEYHQTNQFMGIAKHFVTKQLVEDFDVSKADQIDYLNRSVEYFRQHDTFDKEEFETEVFGHDNLIASFRRFDQTYREEHDMDLSDNFQISTQAVKKQARVFKSVLKLDKNFHIYIHGNRELIEQGIDPDGRKFYKIYYEDEA